MKSVSVTEFKAHCLEMVAHVSQSGESLLLTKRGRPTAVLSPLSQEKGHGWIPGQFKDKAKIVGDIVSPLDEVWEPDL